MNMYVILAGVICGGALGARAPPILGYYSRADEEVMEITSQVVVHYKSLRVKCNGFSTSGRKSNPKKIIE